MRFRLSFRHCARPVLPAILAATVSAKVDLGRIDPVPPGEQIPVMDFFREPLLRDPSVNIAGTHIAAIVSSGEDHTGLIVYDRKTRQIEALSLIGDTDISAVTWLDAQRIGFITSVAKMSGFAFCAGRIGALQDSYPVLQNVSASIIAIPPDDRTHPLVRLGPHGPVTGQYGEVVNVDAAIESGKLIDLSGAHGANPDEAAEGDVRHISTRYPVIETPSGFDLYYLADKQGRLEFGVTSTAGVQTLHRLVGNAWKTCPEDLDAIELFGAGDKPGTIVELPARSDRQPRPLQVVNADDESVVEPLLNDPAYDFDGWLFRDPVSHDIVGAIYDRAGPSVAWFTEPYRDLQKAIDRLFPGMIARILGIDDAGKIVLVSTFSDRQPPIYQIVDLDAHTAGPIRNSAPWIDPARMQPMSVTKFKTRDGRKLDAYVTLPAGASRQHPPPLVVLPHDYVFGRDTWGYNAETQFFASRGYAVLRPNYRGSAGTRWMFPESDDWDYRKMRDDVIDATKALLDSGYVDPKRVAIIGTGFGGYLALAGAAFEPAVFQCTVAVSPVCDWANTLKDQKYYQYSGAYFSRMARKLGDPAKEPDRFDAISPLRHAGAIRAATLVACGEYDASSEIGDAKSLVATVQHSSVPAEFVSFPNEAGGMHHLDHKIELYSRIETFLAQHLGAAPAAGK
ncbi:MAG TPA: alpha/beta fold hydrolase [Opitutus sp.]|nr:alpha/beta fold hydrolase [Opitutus sp.]